MEKGEIFNQEKRIFPIEKGNMMNQGLEIKGPYKEKINGKGLFPVEIEGKNRLFPIIKKNEGFVKLSAVGLT